MTFNHGTLTYVRALTELGVCDKARATRIRSRAMLAVYIALHGGGEASGCYAAYETIATALGCGYSTVLEGVDILVKEGVIAKEYRHNKTCVLRTRPLATLRDHRGSTRGAPPGPVFPGVQAGAEAQDSGDDYSSLLLEEIQSAGGDMDSVQSPDNYDREVRDLSEFFRRHRVAPVKEFGHVESTVRKLLHEGYTEQFIFEQLVKLLASTHSVTGEPFTGYALAKFVHNADQQQCNRAKRAVDTAYQEALPALKRALDWESMRGDPDGWAATLAGATKEELADILRSYRGYREEQDPFR